MILRDEQVGRAIAVVVAGDDGAWIFQLNFVEADVGGDVFESIGAEIAEEADFAFAVCGFADRYQVDPAIVVVVECGDSASASPIRFGEFDLLKALSLPVAPKRYSWRIPVRKARSIQPSWLKSKTAIPAVGAERAPGQTSSTGNLPSRGFPKTLASLPNLSGQCPRPGHCYSRCPARSRPAPIPKGRRNR